KPVLPFAPGWRRPQRRRIRLSDPRRQASSVMGAAPLGERAPALDSRRQFRRALLRSEIRRGIIEEDRRPARQEQFVAAWLVVRIAGACDPLPEGNFGLRQLWRLHPGPSQLCRVLDAGLLQGIAQRSVRTLPGGWQL